MADVTYRWLANHSMLNAERGDAILVGASKLGHLEQNIKAHSDGSLPDDVVIAVNEGWDICRADSPEYFTLFKGGAI